MDNIKLEAITREDHYLKFFTAGGDLNSLPVPISRRDKNLYAMCISGFGLPQRATGFYRCLLNSQANGQNFCSGILDLGEKRVTTAKARFRFTLRNSSASLPIGIGIRLFAKTSPGRDSVSGYNIMSDNSINAANVTANKEYTVEGTFLETGNGVALNQCRYLIPFLSLTKESGTDSNFTIKHLIDLHEISIEVDGKIYDITDTVSDFSPRAGSNITYVENVISEQGLTIRKAPWFGKTIACLGDSITFGMKSGGNATEKEDNPWASQLKECGFINIRNYGISGSTVSEVATKSPMHTRVVNIDANADIVLFMGGTNDLAGNVPLGQFKADDSTLDNTTFYGALQTVAKSLKERFANKPIVFMTPLNAVNQNIPNGISTILKLTMEDYRKAIREVANHYSFHIVELQDLVGFNALIDADKPNFITDGVHPNQAGHDRIFKVLKPIINSLA